LSKRLKEFKRSFGEATPAAIFIASILAVLFFVVELAIGVFLQSALTSIAENSRTTAVRNAYFSWELHIEAAILVIFALGCSRALLQWAQGYLQSSMGERVAARIRQLAFLRLTKPKGDSSSSGEYGETSMLISELAGRSGDFVVNILAFVPTILIFLFLSCAALWIGRSIMLGILTFSVLLALTSKGLVGLTRSLAMRAISTRQHLHGVVQGMYRNLTFIRIMRTEKLEFGRLTGLNVASLNTEFKLAFIRGFAAGIPSASGALVTSVFLLLISRWGMPEAKAQIITQLYILIRISSYSGNLIYLVTELSRTFPVASRVVDMMRYVSDDELNAVMENLKYANLYKGRLEPRLPVFRKDAPSVDTAVEHQQSVTPPRIEFIDVSFGYEKSSRSIVNNLSFAIEPGEQFGIIGASGSGKSTILGLMLGLIKPLNGVVKIDGQPVEEYFAENSHHIGYVGVEPFLIGGTIQQNLDYGSIKTYTEIDYQRVLKLAKLVDVVERFPLRMGHVLSDNGDGLSAGEKQRIAIARALLRKPKFLVLDEVTSNLDTVTESEITQMLRSLKGTVTTVIVSHRSATLQFANRVYDAEKQDFALHLREIILKTAF